MKTHTKSSDRMPEKSPICGYYPLNTTEQASPAWECVVPPTHWRCKSAAQTAAGKGAFMPAVTVEPTPFNWRDHLPIHPAAELFPVLLPGLHNVGGAR
jgi:hypothetical protein